MLTQIHFSIIQEDLEIWYICITKDARRENNSRAPSTKSSLNYVVAGCGEKTGGVRGKGSESKSFICLDFHLAFFFRIHVKDGLSFGQMLQKIDTDL